MNNTSNLIKHVLVEGNIYMVDYSAPAPVWRYAMPFAQWVAQQKELTQNQFPDLHGKR